jgi:SPP1 family predicted phage head-tail adaptor
MSRYRAFPTPRAGLAAGAKDRPVTIEQLTRGEDESGFPIETWTELTALEWMHREDLGGAERFVAGTETSPIDSSWLMGFRPDMNPEAIEVTAERRLRYEGRVYDIIAAQLVGMRDGIQLLTLSAVANPPGGARSATGVTP